VFTEQRGLFASLGDTCCVALFFLELEFLILLGYYSVISLVLLLVLFSLLLFMLLFASKLASLFEIRSYSKTDPRLISVRFRSVRSFLEVDLIVLVVR